MRDRWYLDPPPMSATEHLAAWQRQKEADAFAEEAYARFGLAPPAVAPALPPATDWEILDREAGTALAPPAPTAPSAWAPLPPAASAQSPAWAPRSPAPVSPPSSPPPPVDHAWLDAADREEGERARAALAAWQARQPAMPEPAPAAPAAPLPAGEAAGWPAFLQALAPPPPPSPWELLAGLGTQALSALDAGRDALGQWANQAGRAAGGAIAENAPSIPLPFSGGQTVGGVAESARQTTAGLVNAPLPMAGHQSLVQLGQEALNAPETISQAVKWQRENMPSPAQIMTMDVEELERHVTPEQMERARQGGWLGDIRRDRDPNYQPTREEYARELRNELIMPMVAGMAGNVGGGFGGRAGGRPPAGPRANIMGDEPPPVTDPTLSVSLGAYGGKTADATGVKLPPMSMTDIQGLHVERLRALGWTEEGASSVPSKSWTSRTG